jgi:transcriptional regulator with XRE-family HTH domain
VNPPFRSRELGEGLRAALVRAKLTGRDMARQLEWSPGRIWRLLSGKRGGSETDVISFMAFCRVTGAERDRLLKLCRDADTPEWLQKHGDRLPKQLLTLIDHEDKATAIWDFQSSIIHGLLQNADYARELIIEGGNVPDLTSPCAWFRLRSAGMPEFPDISS